MLNAGNVTFMLGCTNARLDQLMGTRTEPDRVFHYLPFSFAASWIAMLSFLSRESTLTLSIDLAKLAEELKIAKPNYFLNVPTLLERVRKTIQETIPKRGKFAATVFAKAQIAFARRKTSEKTLADTFWLALANRFMFPTIRAGIGPNLKGLICGSAPLSIETQQFFMMLGIPVLQVYGLTETTAICTMDDPQRVEPGSVGIAVPGTEMQIATDTGEMLVRGPHIFPGYWKRPEQTAQALEGGWFHTGDQGEIDANGNWRITGRLKNLIVLNSGHKVPPEPLESAIAQSVPEAEQVVLVGDQRSFLSALVAVSSGNGSNEPNIQSALDRFNAEQPHYKQVRAFKVIAEPFSMENGMLTSNGKLKRGAILRTLRRGDRSHVPEESRMKKFQGKTLSWSCVDGTIELLLDRAPCNEIGSATLPELERFVAALPELQREAHALIISSARQEGFCAGADLRELYRESLPLQTEERVQRLREFLERIHRVMNAIDSAPLTTIAAIQGIAFGGGFELALVCDLIIADKTARFCFPELRLGLIPGFGGIPRLKRDLGNAIVRDLLLTGRSINATKAQAVGLVSQVVAEGDALRIARFPLPLS